MPNPPHVLRSEGMGTVLRHLACRAVPILMVASGVISCRPGQPVINPGPKPAGVTGTISGTVTGSEGASPVGRQVTAIDVKTGARHQVKTNVDGHYTMQLPPGTYRLEVELKAGESVARAPEQVELTASDLEPDRDFVITAAPPGGTS
jgi:hypothetical protein